MADNAEEVVKLIRSVFNKCVSTLIAFLLKVNCILHNVFRTAYLIGVFCFFEILKIDKNY